nr:hypothetical protein [uncultured Neokomagataea sp.]
MKTVSAAAGRRVVAPDGTPVPEKFQVNPADPYWARMLREGDLVSEETPVQATSSHEEPAHGDETSVTQAASGHEEPAHEHE